MGKTPIELKCGRCGYKWSYKGKSKFYTSCPRCRNSNVNVKKHHVAETTTTATP